MANTARRGHQRHRGAGRGGEGPRRGRGLRLGGRRLLGERVADGLGEGEAPGREIRAAREQRLQLDAGDAATGREGIGGEGEGGEDLGIRLVREEGEEEGAEGVHVRPEGDPAAGEEFGGCALGAGDIVEQHRARLVDPHTEGAAEDRGEAPLGVERDVGLGQRRGQGAAEEPGGGRVESLAPAREVGAQRGEVQEGHRRTIKGPAGADLLSGGGRLPAGRAGREREEMKPLLRSLAAIAPVIAAAVAPGCARPAATRAPATPSLDTSRPRGVFESSVPPTTSAQQRAQGAWCAYLEALYQRATGDGSPWRQAAQCNADTSSAAPEMLERTAACAREALEGFDGDPFTPEYAAQVKRCGTIVLETMALTTADLEPYVALVCQRGPGCDEPETPSCRTDVAQRLGPRLGRALGALNAESRVNVRRCLAASRCEAVEARIDRCLEPVLDRLLWTPG